MAWAFLMFDKVKPFPLSLGERFGINMLVKELYIMDTTGIARNFLEELQAESADGFWKLEQTMKAAEDNAVFKYCVGIASQFLRAELYESFDGVDPGFASGGDSPWVPTAVEYFGSIPGIIEAVGFKVLEEEGNKSRSLWSKICSIPSEVKQFIFKNTIGSYLAKQVKGISFNVNNQAELGELVLYLFLTAILHDCVLQKVDNGIKSGSHNPG